MSSNSKTQYLGLNQWIESDVPKMEDFNRDNLITDTVIMDHCENLNRHLEAGEKEYLSHHFGTFSYLGNGEGTRTFDLDFGFEPKLCIVFAAEQTPQVVDIGNDTVYNYFGIATPVASTYGLHLEGNQLTVKQGLPIYARYQMRSYNEQFKSYLVVGIR